MLAGALLLGALLPSLAQSRGPGLVGDVNGDGRITSADALAVYAFLAGRPLPATFDVPGRGDANGDGTITRADAELIMRAAVGRADPNAPVGKPQAPGSAPAAGPTRLTCVASLAGRSVRCEAPGATAGDGGTITYGGQHQYVSLLSDNVAVQADTFAFDVRVVNKIPQRIGTLDGVTPDTVRVFFAIGPINTTANVAATIQPVNHDGAAPFTGTDPQRFYAYPGILAQEDTSPRSRWKLQFEPGVQTFTFFLYVNSPVQFPAGYVDVYPKTATLAAGGTLQLADTVRNPVGKPIAGATSTWSSSNAAVATVSATGLVTAVGDGVVEITAASPPRAPGKATITVTTASADSSRVTAVPDTVAVGDTSVVTLQVRNSVGQPVTQGGATVVLAPSAGTLTPVVDNGNGTYTAKLSSAVVGDVKVSGTLNGNTLLDTARVYFRAGAPVKLGMATQPPASAQSGVTLAQQPVVQVQDASGNPVGQAGVTVTAAISSGGGTLGGTLTATTSASGTATFTDLSITGTVGKRTLAFSATGLASVVSDSVTVGAGAPASVTKQAGTDNQSAMVGTSVPSAPALLVTDAAGNPVPGVAVVFAVASGGGSVTGENATTDASGIATVGSWTAGTVAGTNTLTATAGALAPVTFTATGTPGLPASIAKTAGDEQTGTVDAAVAVAPQVTVRDQYNNPVPGATVTFTVTGGGGSVTGATPATDGSGVASVGSWTLGGGPQANALQASVSAGTASSVTFAAYVPPTATPDSSQAMGNTTLPSSVAPNVLANDVSINGGAISLTTTGALPTARNGTLTLASDGTFSYVPAVGITGRDSVQYTINDTRASASAWIKMRFVGKVWYVDGSVAPGGNGRDATPFQSISVAISTGNIVPGTGPGVNDTILVRTGAPNTTSATLRAGQLVYGAGASAPFTTTLNGQTVTLLATGTAPSIGALTLNSGNTLNGFTTTGTITGNGFGTLTVDQVAVNNTTGAALSLTTGSLAGSGFTSVQSGGGNNNVLLSGVSTSGTATIGRPGDVLSGATSNGVSVSGGSGSFSIPANISNATSFAVSVTGKTGGAVTFSGDINPGSPGRGIAVASNSSGANTIVFSGTTKSISSAGAAGVVLSGNTGATIQFTNGGLTIATTTGTPFSAAGGGTVEVTGSGNTITASGAAARAVDLNGITIGTNGIGFASINSNGTTTSSAFRANSVTGTGSFTAGSLTVAGTTGGASRGIELTSNSAPFTFTTASVNGTNGEGIYLTSNTGAVAINGGTVGNSSSIAGDALLVSAGNADVTVAASLAKSTAGRIANVNGRTGGTTTISGTLSCTTNCTGISVTGNTAGTVSFTNATKTVSTGTSAAVTLTNNSGSTISFTSGGLAVTTTTGHAFAATGGGTVTVEGANNTISTNTGTALNVSSTDIGASGLTFRSISAGTASFSPANGIVLSNTGNLAGLTVSGNGAAGSGGTIQNTTGSGVQATGTRDLSLSWMNLTNATTTDGGVAGGSCSNDNVSTCNGAIDLMNATGVTLNRLAISGSAEQGIVGSNVTNFSLSNSTIQNAGGDPHEHGILFTGLFGTSSITSTSVTGSYEANFRALNTNGSATLTVTGSTFSNTSAAGGADGFLFDAQGTASATVNVSGSTFAANKDDHFNVTGANSATVNVTFASNTLSGGNASSVGQGIALRAGGTYSGTFTYDINDNTLNGALPTAINVGFGSTSASGLLRGRIRNNRIGTSGVALSGSAQGSCILAEANGTGTGTHTVSITNNILRRCYDKGIDLLGSRDGSNNLNATVTGNSVDELVDVSSRWAIRLETGSSLLNETGAVCADIANNTLNAAAIGDEMSVRARSPVTLRFPGYTGGTTDGIALQNYLTARNPAGGQAAATASSGATFNNTSPAGSTCPTPP